MKFRELKLRKDPNCKLCGTNPSITQLIDYEQFCGITPEEPLTETSDFEITVKDLKKKVDTSDDFFLLDVREPQEYQICAISGSTLIPLGELPNRLGELEGQSNLIVHCRSGVRSAKAVTLLRESGFSNAKNLKGGILAWIDQIDPSLPKY
jgi:adenylyltransferase/sulfurtransferase